MQQENQKALYLVLKFIADVFSVNLSLFLATLFLYDFTIGEYFNIFSELIIIISMLTTVLMSIFKLYQSQNTIDVERTDLLSRIATVLFILFFLLSSFNFMIPSYGYDWSLLILFYFLTVVIVISFRLAIFRLEKKFAAAKNIAVVGGTQEVKELITKIQAKSDSYNLKTVIVNEYEESLEQQLSKEVDTYFGFKWLEPTIDRLENTDILLIAYNNLDDRVKARFFNLKSSHGTKIYILPAGYDPSFFDPDLIHQEFTL
jgi:FlaA1/EpsC-like NDP-sugar epimerase